MTFTAVFAGSPQVAVPYLESLIASGITVTAVLTRSDAPVGRKRILTPTPVAQCAERHGIPVIKANSLRDVELPDSDIGLVVAYGALIPQRVLDGPRLGWLNVHFSHLPEWRGAAPVQRAIIAGATSIGVSIFRLVAALDAGPVVWAADFPIDDTVTASEALDFVAQATASDLVTTAQSVVDGTATFVQQTGDASYAHKLDRADGRIDWSHSSDTVHALIRGVSDEPGAYTMWGDAPLGVVRSTRGPSLVGEPGVVIVEGGRVLVHCGTGTLELTRVKPAGKSVMAATDWARGVRDEVKFV